MKYRLIAIIFSLILFLGLLLRLYNLAKIPNSISADEAALGYNAYSLLKTGRDEFGQAYPLAFRSFDDYKNPIYVYLLIPFVYVAGLSEWAVRLPSLLAGVLAIGLSVGICFELFRRKRLALLVGFLTAALPWLVQYSRVGIEIGLAYSLSLLGVWLFLLGRKKPLFFILAAGVFGVDFYTYHSSKVWVPIIWLILTIFVWRFAFWKHLSISSCLLAVCTLPFLLSTLWTNEAASRPYTVSIFFDQQAALSGLATLQFDRQNGDLLQGLLHNRRIVTAESVINGFLKISSPDILFGQSIYNQIPQVRLLYLWMAPLIIIGGVALSRQKREFLLLFGWLVVALIPGALTALPVFDRRILLAAFPLVVFAGYGVLVCLSWCQQSWRYRQWGGVLIWGILVLSCFWYIHNYFFHGPTTAVKIWGSGMKELVQKMEQEKTNYSFVVVSPGLNEPLIYTLFYTAYSPEKYLASGGTRNGAHAFGGNLLETYRFDHIDERQLQVGTLYVWDVDEKYPCLKVTDTVLQSDGKIMAYLGEADAKNLVCE